MNPELLDLEGWMRDGLSAAPSPIHGEGVFTANSIRAGEPVIRWGGRLSLAQMRAAGGLRPHTAVAVAEGVLLAAHAGDPATLDDLMNHSCDSNLWMGDAVTLVARRDIQPGDEITADYALWMDDSAYVMKQACQCGAASCRGTVTGKDWQRTDVQQRYQRHFSPFVERRIRSQR